jgi:hypothetical protein
MNPVPWTLIRGSFVASDRAVQVLKCGALPAESTPTGASADATGGIIYRQAHRNGGIIYDRKFPAHFD